MAVVRGSQSLMALAQDVTKMQYTKDFLNYECEPRHDGIVRSLSFFIPFVTKNEFLSRFPLLQFFSQNRRLFKKKAVLEFQN